MWPPPSSHEAWRSILAVHGQPTAGRQGWCASFQPTLSNLLELSDDGHYFLLGQFGPGAIAFLVPPPTALHRHSATVFGAGIPQAASIKVTTDTPEGGPQHEFVARILPQVSSSPGWYRHNMHLPSTNVRGVRQRNRPQRAGSRLLTVTCPDEQAVSAVQRPPPSSLLPGQSPLLRTFKYISRSGAFDSLGWNCRLIATASGVCRGSVS